ncbi:MAG: alpha/beta fold hydrolase [Actinobacteria bacterium]|nr:alpha/beta fold hydrolase [Actinomycetota bacterium]
MKQHYRKYIAMLVMLVGLALMAGCQTGAFASADSWKGEIQTYYTETADGWTLQVDRFEPDEPDPAANPVVLCHGLSYNNRFWDLTEKVSLARYLAAAGYEVWSVSLRGAGLSDQPLASVLRKVATGSVPPKFFTEAYKHKLGSEAFSDYSVDDHINYDVPAVIRLVKDQTGAQKVHWVGHSMGGMIMFAYLATHPQEAARDVDTFVAVSVPMAMFHPLNKAMQLQVDNAAALKAGNVFISTSYDAFVAKILGKLAPPTISETLFLNRDNVDDGVLRLLAQWAQESISPGQLDQLFVMAAEESFYSKDRKINYTALLDRVTTPTFFLAGQLDNMATVGAVKFAYRQVSSQEKAFKLFARINNNRADYGHDDIIIGKYAREEVYPEILNWLKAHRRGNKVLTTPLPLQP